MQPLVAETRCSYKSARMPGIASRHPADCCPALCQANSCFTNALMAFPSAFPANCFVATPITFEEEEPIDIHAVMEEIKELEAKRADLDKEINVYLKELGLLE